MRPCGLIFNTEALRASDSVPMFFSEKDSATLCSSSNIANPSMLLIKEQCSVKAPTLNYKKTSSYEKGCRMRAHAD